MMREVCFKITLTVTDETDIEFLVTPGERSSLPTTCGGVVSIGWHDLCEQSKPFDFGRNRHFGCRIRWWRKSGFPHT